MTFNNEQNPCRIEQPDLATKKARITNMIYSNIRQLLNYRLLTRTGKTECGKDFLKLFMNKKLIHPRAEN